MKQLQKINHPDEKINRIQDNISNVFSSIFSPLLNGILIKDVSLSAVGDNLVAHKLGRPPIGYFHTRKNAASDIYDSNTINNRIDEFLILKCSVSCVVDLFVF